MDRITIVWISFLSILIIVGILYSLLTPDVEEEVDTFRPVLKKFIRKARKKSVPKKSKPKVSNSKPKVVKPVTKKVTVPKPTTKPKVKKPAPKKPTPKVKKPAPKKPTPKVKKVNKVIPKSQPTTKVVKSTPVKKVPNQTVSTPKKIQTIHYTKVVKKAPDVKSNPSPIPKKVKDATGFSFNGVYGKEEISLVKNSVKTTRGYIIQSLDGKVVLKKWLKTKPAYDKMVEALTKKYDANGRYVTYLIWYGDVTRTILGSKIG